MSFCFANAFVVSNSTNWVLIVCVCVCVRVCVSGKRAKQSDKRQTPSTSTVSWNWNRNRIGVSHSVFACNSIYVCEVCPTPGLLPLSPCSSPCHAPGRPLFKPEKLSALSGIYLLAGKDTSSWACLLLRWHYATPDYWLMQMHWGSLCLCLCLRMQGVRNIELSTVGR